MEHEVGFSEATATFCSGKKNVLDELGNPFLPLPLVHNSVVPAGDGDLMQLLHWS